MALGFGSSARLERLLLKTRNILGEGDLTLCAGNKAQALQTAASLYELYDGDGSESTYTDRSSLTVLQSEMIATAAAIDLISSAVSYYKDDVVTATGAQATGTFRSDKLNWLAKQVELLKEKLALLESANGFQTGNDVPGLVMAKVRAIADPDGDVYPAEDSEDEAFEITVGVTS